jgi:hypothetical protein
MYSLSNSRKRDASLAGNRSARKYAVPIAFASNSSEFFRWSYRLTAIAKLKPIIRPSNVSPAFRRISKSSRSPCLKGRTLFRIRSPAYAAAHWATRATTNTTNGLSKVVILWAFRAYALRTRLDLRLCEAVRSKSSWTEVQWQDPMSALGQRRTFRSAIAMSALPPKADIPNPGRSVRFVPIADTYRS